MFPWKSQKVGVLLNLQYLGHIFLTVEGRNRKIMANRCIQEAVSIGRLFLVALVTRLPW